MIPDHHHGYKNIITLKKAIIFDLKIINHLIHASFINHLFEKKSIGSKYLSDYCKQERILVYFCPIIIEV